LLYLTAISQTGPAGVEDIANTPFWFDANQIDQVNATSISSWINQGSNSENASQSTAANQPIYRTGQINGQAVADFDGVNDYLEIASNDDLDNNGPFASRTFMLVVRTSADISTRQTIYEEGGSTRGLNIYIYNGNLYIAGWNEASDGAGSPWNFAFVNTAVSANTSYIVTYVFDGNNTTTGTIDGYLNSTNNFGTISNVGLLYDHNNAIVGAQSNGTKYETGNASGDGAYFSGEIAELVIFNQAINDSDRIILENSLAAKYNLNIGGNDVYTMDNAGNGHHDFEMAGIGRISASDLNQSAQGSSYFQFSNASDLNNNEYILWGHDGADDDYSANTSDVPSSEGIYSRMNREWRASVGGAPGTVDLSVFLDNSCASDFTPDNAYLLIDTNLDGDFSDETVGGGGVISLTDVGSGEYQTTSLNIVNGSRFTIGFAESTPPTYTQVTGPAGIGDGTINRFWFRANDIGQNDNTVVTNWANIGGATQAFTQSTGSRQPIFETNQQNGFPMVRFDGTDDYFQMTNNNDINIGGPYTSRTFFTAFNTGTDISSRQVIYEEGGTGRGINIYMFSGQLYVGGWNINDDGSDSPWGFESISTPVTASTSYILTFEFNGNSCQTGNFSMYLNGTLIGTVNNIGRLYNHSGAIGLGAKNGDTYYESGGSSGTGDYFEGSVAEFIVYNTKLFNPQRIIIENYLAAKYGLTLSSNDIYAEDGGGAGDFDYDVSGIGRENGIEIDEDSQGPGAIRILNPSDLDDDEYLIWGHNNLEMEANNKSDVPASVEARFDRIWRLTETSSTGTPIDLGSIDIRWDLSAFNNIMAEDLALLIDTDNDGFFADETPITGASDLGGSIFEFASVSQISNGTRMTLGTGNLDRTPLPIDLLDFSATIVNESVQLKWKTATETNNDYFTIERSKDGQLFSEIEQIKGAGDSEEILEYSYFDNEPLSGVSYYRLRQTDFDGQYEVFDMVIVSFEPDQKQIQIQIYPNPTTDLVHINTDTRVSLFNSNGSDISREIETHVATGKTTLNLQRLPKGFYLLKVNGGTHRIIKM
ncbi:MAG: T9SS type A sorting domain-containing protein, partial [Marinoscillum sp.]